MRAATPGRRATSSFAVIAGSAAIYGLAARLALWMAIPPGYATAVWPAAGLALVCALTWGGRAAIGIALGSFAVNVTVAFDSGTPVAVARSLAVPCAIAIAASLQATVGAALIRWRVGFPTTLHDERHIVWFMVLGGPAACVVCATLGVTALSLFGTVPWSSFGFHWWTWWIGDTIGVLVFAPLALLAVPDAHPVWRRRRGIVGIPLALGFAAVAVLFLRVSGWEQTRLRRDFERRAVPIEAVLQSQLATYEEVVTSMASFFDASEDVTRHEFHIFCVRALARYPAITVLSWNPLVPGGQRGELERRAQISGSAGFRFTEQSADGTLRAAGERDAYAPAYYVEPVAGNERVLGYDLLSDPPRRDALERANRFGALAATQRVQLIQGGGTLEESAGVLLVAPAFREAPAHQLLGYTVGAFRLQNLVEKVLATIDHDGIAVRLLDRSQIGESTVLYASHTASAPFAATDEPRIAAIHFADRRWQLEIAPTAALRTNQRSWQAWTVLAAGQWFVGMLGIVLLITTGRTFRLHEGAERFRALVEASAQIVWTSTASGEVIEDSPSWRAFTGQSFDAWRGWGRFAAIHPDDAASLHERRPRAITTKSVVETEYRVRHAGGEWRWTAARAVPLLDERGELRGWVNSNTDITDKKRAADQFRIAIDAAPTGMLMIDRAGRIALVNTEVEKLFGYARAELVGSPIELLVPGRLRGQHPAHRADLFASPGTRPMGGDRDLHGVRKDGSEVPIEIGLNPLRAGDQDYVLVSIVDITERKHADAERERFFAELKKLNAELEQRVAARTSELTAALREREVLLQEVHHRVKNNLQVISSLMNMQVRKLADATARMALEECQTRVQAIALIHEQLYQSRDYANVPFSEYARVLVNNVVRTMGVAHDSVKLDLAIADVAVPVDKAIPCGLLLNELITNALKHAFPDGRSGELRVELSRAADQIRLVVRDNGVGLPTDLDVRGTQSLGLRLVNLLARQLRATLAIGTGPGASFELNFAVEN